MEEKIQDAGSVGQAPRGYWILITGQAAGTNRYAWSQVNDADTGFGTSLGAGFAMSGTSATTGWPAYEINGRQDVPADSTVRVLAFPSAAGTYWVFEYEGTAGGSGTAGTYPGWYMGLTSDACLVLTVLSAAGFCAAIDTSQVVYLEWTTGLTWVGAPVFVHDTGDGAAQLVISNGEPHLTIDAVELGIEERGNGYLIFAGGGTTLCDGTVTECGDNTFRVKVECIECLVVGCCATPVPRVLTLTITGSCECFNGTDTLIYNASGTFAGAWTKTETTLCGSTGGGGNGIVWVLSCISSAWSLRLFNTDGSINTTISAGGFSVGLTENSCEPLSLSYTGSARALDGGPIGQADVTAICGETPSDITIAVTE